MKVFLNKSVLNAALERIEFLYSEFSEVVVTISGGKDSTVVYHLCLMVAEKLGRLPLKVMFIDQEAEWQGTINYIEKVMNSPSVTPYWYQMPMVISNNASVTDRYSHCWDNDSPENWMRKKSGISIKENNYGTDRFHDLFAAIAKVDFPDNTCFISGVRATYKHVTYGKVLTKSKEQYSFYPIYDWSYTDVWKFIQDNNFDYNDVYNQFYRYGTPVNQMRVSNLHHETALHHIMQVQEIEPQTWEKLQHKISGANTIKHLKAFAYECPKDLPKMFESWKEYATYLIENLVDKEENKDKITKYIEKCNGLYDNSLIEKTFYRTIINTVLSSDWDMTKISNFELRQETNAYRHFKKGVYKPAMIPYMKYLTESERELLRANINATHGAI